MALASKRGRWTAPRGSLSLRDVSPPRRLSFCPHLLGVVGMLVACDTVFVIDVGSRDGRVVMSPGGGGGSESSDAGPGGSGGMVGAAGGMGGVASLTDNPVMGGTGGQPPVTTEGPCSGCIELAVPVNGPNQRAGFRILFSPNADLSTATVTWRVRTLTPDAEFNLLPFTQNGANLNYAGHFCTLLDLTEANGFGADWMDVTQDFSAPPAGDPCVTDPFDSSQVFQVGLQLGSSSDFSGAGTIRLLVDSLTFTGVDSGALDNRDFTEGLEGMELRAASQHPGPQALSLIRRKRRSPVPRESVTRCEGTCRLRALAPSSAASS